MPKVTKSGYTVELSKDEWEIVRTYIIDSDEYCDDPVENAACALVDAVSDLLD